LSGAFSWTPTEAQGPGNYPITVRVTDSASPSQSDFETITVTVNGLELARKTGEFKLGIDANSAEEVHVEQLPEPFTRDLLASLQNREVNSLPFFLSGSVRTLESGRLRFEQKGHLYPVPGKPGFFRSAVTQAEELRREDRL